MTSLPKASPAVIRVVLATLMMGGLGAMVLLASDGGGGGVDLFTDDLAGQGVDSSEFIAGDGGTQAASGAGSDLAVPEALAQVATADDEPVEGAEANDSPTALLAEEADTVPGDVPTPLQGAGEQREATALADTDDGDEPALSQTVRGGDEFTNPALIQPQTSNVTGTATTPIQQVTTDPVTGVIQQITTDPVTGVTEQITTDPVTDVASPIVAPAGPWCQIEVRQTDGVIRWDNDGKTTVFRRNDVWFHTPDEQAQAVLIPEAVNTNDDYVMRLWGGGTTDVTCSVVTSANVNDVTPTPTNNAPAASPDVATVAALPTPIAVPGGPVQMGFSADLWADDRTNYWNDLEAVPGNGRLIAHEFKSFTKDIKTDVYRWHLESGRDLLLTWNGTDAESILNGSHDDWIREHARELRSLPGTVMLRFWHEPDVSHKRAWIDDDPQQFIDSWLYVRQIFVEENTNNIEWVWCPTAWNWEQQGARYYPGDANVDWICSDGYTGWDLDAPLTDVADAYTAFQAWADQRPNKPILIAEFGAGQRGPGDRAEWVRSIPEWVSASPNIRAVVYFDVDMRPNGEIYDWRLRTEPTAWQEMMDVLGSAPFGR